MSRIRNTPTYHRWVGATIILFWTMAFLPLILHPMAASYLLHFLKCKIMNEERGFITVLTLFIAFTIHYIEVAIIKFMVKYIKSNHSKKDNGIYLINNLILHAKYELTLLITSASCSWKCCSAPLLSNRISWGKSSRPHSDSASSTPAREKQQKRYRVKALQVEQ